MDFPITKIQKGSYPGGILFAIFGFSFSIILTLSVLTQSDPISQSDIIGTAVIIVFGLVFSFIGFFQLYKTQIVVNEKEVSYCRAGLVYRTKSWREPLKNYSGILAYEHYVSRKHSHTIYYCILLLHPDKEKSVEIASYLKPEEQRLAQEELCKKLDLPALIEAEDGSYVERKIKDFDKTVQELKAEGKIKRTGASQKPFPSKKIRLVENDNGFVVERKAGIVTLLAGIVFYLLAIGLFIFAEVPFGLSLVLFIFGTIFSLSFWSMEFLIVTDKEVVHVFYLFGKIKMNKGNIPVDKIEEIKIDSDMHYSNVKKLNQVVAVISDVGRISFGYSIGKEAREWLLDKMIYLVTEKYNKKL